jgi:hypothetical protein
LVLEVIGVPHRDRQFQVGTLLAEVAGRQFATTRRSGHSTHVLSTVGLIQARAPCTVAPGSPVRVSDGSPRPKCASTATRWPRTPTTVTPVTRRERT